jgi:hypothetical protein
MIAELTRIPCTPIAEPAFSTIVNLVGHYSTRKGINGIIKCHALYTSRCQIRIIHLFTNVFTQVPLGNSMQRKALAYGFQRIQLTVIT